MERTAFANSWAALVTYVQMMGHYSSVEKVSGFIPIFIYVAAFSE
jgi:hypothetical protein